MMRPPVPTPPVPRGPRASRSPARASVLLVTLGVLALELAHGPPLARAQAPAASAQPRALVVIAAPPEGDVFLPAWLYEVAAATLRPAGWDVPPRNAAASLLDVDATACAEDDACLLGLAHRARASVLVLVRVERDAEGVAQVTVEGARAGIFGVVRETRRDATGDEARVVAAVQTMVETLAAVPGGCLVTVDAEAAPDVAVTIDGRLLGTPMGFVPPGEHALAVRVTGRAPHSGTLRCEPGQTLVVRVR